MNTLNRKVAEARGWTQHAVYAVLYWHDQTGRGMGDVGGYSPSTNIAQAMELLEEFDEWEINKFDDFTYWVVIFGEKIGANRKKHLAEAICLAYLMAKKGGPG